ncbi:response regulator transcription factor [Paenibacillus sp. Soil522]|uniref:response regulator transcription factor n=1 Tax=Paenibacillus sp. Soil522 TaxID=1736388 RepID=UPI0006F26B02|nr:response regulator [Paenibacillus sp. Soil522]KRE47842.1 hypothetical protein ASG81_07970 [Paenibacillus sp. Soil522]
MKLLIADDQPSLHRFLNKMIDWKALGITEVRHAYNGKEAAEMTEALEPNLLIIDIHMPEWNGIEALKHIRHLRNKPKTIILSAYDQFEYAKEALRLNVSQYMLKPVDALQIRELLLALVQDIRMEARALALRELENATAVERFTENCLAAAKAALTAYGSSAYAVLTVRGPKAGSSWPALGFTEASGIELFPLPPREDTGEWCIFVGLSDADQYAELLLEGEKWQGEWLRLLPGQSFTLGFSQIEEEVALLPKRMEESRQAAKQAFYEAGRIYRYEDGLFAEGAELRTVRHEGLQLEEKLRRGYDTPAALELIRPFFEAAKQRRVEPEEMQEIAHRLLFVFCGSHTGGPGGYNGDFMPLRAYRHACTTFAELMLFWSKYAQAHVAGLAASAPENDVIFQIKKYVDTNFEADLSLQTVADRFFIDKFRLSREFKQLFDENYWTYVTRIRMEQAALFLRETNWRIGMIAERTGYCDESHFSRAFKKYYNVSPREYRGASGERND